MFFSLFLNNLSYLISRSVAASYNFFFCMHSHLEVKTILSDWFINFPFLFFLWSDFSRWLPYQEVIWVKVFHFFDLPRHLIYILRQIILNDFIYRQPSAVTCLNKSFPRSVGVLTQIQVCSKDLNDHKFDTKSVCHMLKSNPTSLPNIIASFISSSPSSIISPWSLNSNWSLNSLLTLRNLGLYSKMFSLYIYFHIFSSSL